MSILLLRNCFEVAGHENKRDVACRPHGQVDSAVHIVLGCLLVFTCQLDTTASSCVVTVHLAVVCVSVL